MDTFAELRAYVAVVDASGFAAAARSVGQSRSALNRLVIGLEDRLGVQLLHRSTRKVAPTSAGRAFYDRARRILEDLAEAERGVRAEHSEAAGRLRITAPLSLGRINISQVVAAFMCAHPRVEVELDLLTRFVDPVAEGYDISVRVAEPDEETTLVDHRILPVPYVACAAPDYLEQHGRPVTPAELRGHAHLYYRRSTGGYQWTFDGPAGRTTVPVTPRLCSNNLEPIIEAARAGLGIAVLPRYAIAEDIAAGRLEDLLAGHAPPEAMLQAIYPPTRHLSANVRLFTDFLRERFQTPLC